MNLLIDINNAFHKSYFVYKNIYKEEKINEKMLFNKFVTDFMYSCRLFSDKNEIDKIICCYDSENNFRKKIYSNYKSNRTKKEQSFYDVLNYSKEFFKKSGFIVSQIDELEADDCIGLWVNHLKDEVNIILSADEDCRQLLNNTTIIYNNNSKDKRGYYFSKNACNHFIDIQNCKCIFESPHWILLKKMILGCDGDMVPKLLKGRIGEATLKKKLYDHITFNKDNVTTSDLVDISARLNTIFKNEDVFVKDLDINLALVNLCSNTYHTDKIKLETKEHFEIAKFTYNGNYQLESY